MTEKNYRPPVVVVLGHVDHGKTTLLDFIRKTRVASKEAGGITQSIGGYEFDSKIKGYHTSVLTFIDTPGHEAFSKLRMRGANVADVAILIIDATASVMPQTVESISHIQQADIPFVVAVNKIDLPTANIEKVKKDLAKNKVLIEGMGGSIPVISISAKKGDGVNDLLEAVLYTVSERNLTWDAKAEPEVYTIEEHQDRGGVAVSCVIKNGTLKTGDVVYASSQQCKIRALINDAGKQVSEVKPSMPFVMLGFKDFPDVGIRLTLTKPEDQKQADQEVKKTLTTQDFFKEEDENKLAVIIKADTQGSLDAIIPALEKNESIDIVLNSLGEISKSDIFLAKISKAIVIGFNISVSKQIEQLAHQEKVIIKTYNIIYNLLDELNEVSSIMKEKEEKSKSLKSESKILAIFTIEGNKIAGVKVEKGRIDVDDLVELIKGNKMKGEAIVTSIKQRAESVKSAKKGDEAGLLLDPELDMRAGDVIKSYSI